MHVDPHVVEVEGGAVEDLINVIIVIVLATQQENAEVQDRIITAEDTAEVDILDHVVDQMNGIDVEGDQDQKVDQEKDLEEEIDRVPDQETDGDHVQVIEDQDLAHVMINVHTRKKKEAIGLDQDQGQDHGVVVENQETEEIRDPAVARDQPQMKTETIVAMTIETIVARGNSLTTNKIEIIVRKINAIIAMKTIVIVTVITRKASPA